MAQGQLLHGAANITLVVTVCQQGRRRDVVAGQTQSRCFRELACRCCAVVTFSCQTCGCCSCLSTSCWNKLHNNASISSWGLVP